MAWHSGSLLYYIFLLNLASQIVPNLCWSDLRFFDFTVVWYTFSRNHTLNFECWSLAGLAVCSTVLLYSFFFSFIYISWRLITLQYCSGFFHTLIWISLGFTCVPHPEPPSHLPPHPIPLGHPSAPVPSTCLMHQSTVLSRDAEAVAVNFSSQSAMWPQGWTSNVHRTFLSSTFSIAFDELHNILKPLL